jgi:translation initiation factor IF-2
VAKTTRVHQLAKDLGVTSKDIVAKCEAEGIPNIENHMSTVSVGLADTIRQWFSAGGGVATAVEVAAPVDVEQARAKAKRKARKPRAGDGVEEAAPVVEETSVAPPSIESVAPDEAAASEPEMTAPSAPVIEQPREAPQPDGGAPAVEAPATARRGRPRSEPQRPQTQVVMNVPQRPTVVKPVGPMLAEPTKVKLSGPTVIRVEAPEVVPTPKPRGERRIDQPPMARGGPRGGRGAGGFAPETTEEAGDSRGGPRGKSATGRNKRRAPAVENKRSARGLANTDQPFNWRQQDLLEREERLTRAGGFLRTHRRDIQRRAQGATQRAVTAARTGGMVAVSEPILIKELSAATGVKAADILKKLFLTGKPMTVNSAIDAATASEVMLQFGIELEIQAQQTAAGRIQQQLSERKVEDERLRPPIVTILGHVDHGKTSLLDRIRDTNVAAGEAGGITQATSAFRVPVKAGDSERQVVFLDTPGHEAFTEMRARGAKVTDLVVLVVAADDGVMPQTIESINHAKAATVPVVVALNKIDKPEATEENIQRIFGQLAEQGLNPAPWGGDTEVVRTSALKGTGIQELLDVLDYQAQLREWKADFAGPADGTVIEAQLEEGRGPVARILVQQGELRKGDFIVVGRGFGRVRDIINDRGERIDLAGPSTPVAISGIDELPDAGDRFYVVDSLRAAENAAEERRRIERERDLAQPKVTLDNIFARMAAGDRKEVRLVVKADVQGSVETLRKALSSIEIEDVTVSVLHAAVGGVNESDVGLAEASGAIIVGFNVTSSSKARQLADQKGIDIRLYDVIYDITDDIAKAAKGLLAPEHRLEVLGHAEVRQVFRISRVGMIAGCYVTDGAIERNAQIRVTREGIVVEKDRRLEQLKRFKDDAREVKAGMECGMKIDGYDDIKVGDVLECYRTIEVART